jgi:acetoin utilization deacetylase AcuC-like enzyme
MKLPVFFDERMAAPPSPDTPRPLDASEVLADWMTLHPESVAVQGFTAAEADDLCVAHDPRYVQRILAGDSGRQHRWAVGSMVAAARNVRRGIGMRGRPFWPFCVACVPFGTFAQAGWNKGSQHCAFNGLAIAAILAIREGAKRVVIIDCAHKHGAGTAHVLERSAESVSITHWSSGEAYSLPVHADRMLSHLSSVVREARSADLTLYQAGADQHIGSPQGGLLTDAQMARRDRIVFRTAAQYNMPLVWTIAGTYGQEPGEKERMLGILRRTLETCVTVEDTL